MVTKVTIEDVEDGKTTAGCCDSPMSCCEVRHPDLRGCLESACHRLQNKLEQLNLLYREINWGALKDHEASTFEKLFDEFEKSLNELDI